MTDSTTTPTTDPVLPLPWVTCTQINACTGQAVMYSNDAVWGGTDLGTGDYGAQPGSWVTVDLKPWGVGANAVAAFLTGILIITGGNVADVIADMTITFARPSDTDINPARYIGQCALQGIGGQRSGISTWVPLENGCFNFMYTVASEAAGWPTGASYGVNMTPQIWIA
jgi:hypothetical protein